MHHRFAAAALVLLTGVWTACNDAASPGGPPPNAAVGLATQVHAEFTFSCVQLSCQFTDRSTTDSGIPPVSNWLWTFGDSATSTDQNPAHTFASPGTYFVTLRAFRSLAESDSVTHPVTVSNDSTTNLPPQVNFTVTCNALTCQFVDQSSDSDGVIVRYDWAFGDGATDTTPNPTHTYATAGTYDVFHAVVDNLGAVDSVHRPLTVTADTSRQLVLQATGFKVNGVQHALLTWSGAQIDTFSVFRDSNQVAFFVTDTTYDDNIGQHGTGTHVYVVCEVGGVCSNTATVTFGGKRR